MKNIISDLQQQIAATKLAQGPVVISDHYLNEISGGVLGPDFYLNCSPGGPCEDPGQGFIRATP